MRDSKLLFIKKIGKPILFFLTLIIIFFVLSRKMIDASLNDDSVIPNRNKSIVRIQKERCNSIDLLILGDSESYCSFSPMKMWDDMGLASFVCGQAGQKIQETYYMLKTVFETQSPKVVVLETNTMFRAQEGMDGLKETIAEKSNYYLPVLRYHDVWKSIFMGKEYSEANYKGFVLRDSIQSYNGGEYMIQTTEKEEITDIVNDYMEKIIDLSLENNAKLCLISVPSSLNYNYKKHNAIQEFADTHSLEFLDLNLKTEELGINWKTDTLDKGDHLNIMGAQKVTEYVENYLMSKYNLSDHHDEDDYENWTEAVKEYKTKINEKLENMQRN